MSIPSLFPSRRLSDPVVEAYSSIRSRLPSLRMRSNSTTVAGATEVLMVQVIRDASRFPKAPRVTIEHPDGSTLTCSDGDGEEEYAVLSETQSRIGVGVNQLLADPLFPILDNSRIVLSKHALLLPAITVPGELESYKVALQFVTMEQMVDGLSRASETHVVRLPLETRKLTITSQISPRNSGRNFQGVFGPALAAYAAKEAAKALTAERLAGVTSAKMSCPASPISVSNLSESSLGLSSPSGSSLPSPVPSTSGSDSDDNSDTLSRFPSSGSLDTMVENPSGSISSRIHSDSSCSDHSPVFPREQGGVTPVIDDSSTPSSSGEAEQGSLPVAAFHRHEIYVGGPSFSVSLLRCGSAPNRRFPPLCSRIRSVLEATENTRFNPYPPPLVHLQNGEWRNWGQTLSASPARIYSDNAIPLGSKEAPFKSPRTKADVQAILSYARFNNLRVRIFGSNHSWAPLTCTDGVMVDNRFLNTTVDDLQSDLPSVREVPNDKVEKEDETPSTSSSSVNGEERNHQRTWPKYVLSLNGSDPLANGKPTVTCPPGVTTGDVERWLASHGDYCFPSSTVEDCFSMGGILSTGCHGTGKKQPPMSDWIVAMEFFDANGELQRITRDSCDERWLQYVTLPASGDVPHGENVLLQLTPADVFKVMLTNLGSLGVIWSYTVVIHHAESTYFTSKLVPWKELFDDTDAARENLRALQEKHETFEVFYFPFAFKSGSLLPRVEKNPNVYVWLIDSKADTSPSATPVYEPRETEFLARDLLHHLIAYIKPLFHLSLTYKWATPILPYLCAMMSSGAPLTRDAQGNACTWKVPRWRALHPINSGAVELLPALDIEWCCPMELSSAKGFSSANRAFGDIIRAIHAAHDSSTDPWDMNRFPISVAAEMRILAPSEALLSPQYLSETYNWQSHHTGEAFCVPEVVTHAGNKAWNAFYQKLNTRFTSEGGDLNQQKASPTNGKDDRSVDDSSREEKDDGGVRVQGAGRYGAGVKVHLAKEFAVIPGMLSYLRRTYRSQPYRGTNVFDMFCAVRDRIDPERRFCNDFLTQFLYSDVDQYQPPENQPVFTQGLLQRDTKGKGFVSSVRSMHRGMLIFVLLVALCAWMLA